MTEDHSNAITLGALGMLSGALSWASNLVAESTSLHFSTRAWGPFLLEPFSICPGLVFGLVIGVLFHRRGKVGGYRLLGYVLAGGLAYFCAWHVAFHVINRYFSGINGETIAGSIVGEVLAGLVGSLLLGLVTIRLLRVPARAVLQWSVGVGGAAGALLGITTHDHTEWGWTLLPFFVLWQGAYAASLASLMRQGATSGNAGRVG